MEVVLPPLSGLGRHVVLVIVQEMAPGKDSSSQSGKRRRSDEEAGGDGGSVEGLPAVLLQTFGLVGAVEELALEELHGDDGEDEHEEDVDDEDVEDVLQRVDHAVEHGLGGSHTNTLQVTLAASWNLCLWRHFNLQYRSVKVLLSSLNSGHSGQEQRDRLSAGVALLSFNILGV